MGGGCVVSERAGWPLVGNQHPGRRSDVRGDRRRGRTAQAVRFIEHAAAADAAIDDVSAWHAANPGIADGIKSLAYMGDAARRALASPADQAAFRAYDLNQPQAPSREMICLPGGLRRRCIVAPDDLPERSGECVRRV